MELKYPVEWRIDGVGFPMPEGAVHDFWDLLLKLGDNWEDFERCKWEFGLQSRSTSASWARSDLRDALDTKATDAVEFVVAIWRSFDKAQFDGGEASFVRAVNGILTDHSVPLTLDPPDLRKGNTIVDQTPVRDEGGSRVAPLDLGSEIGSGAFGVVYEATRRTVVGEFTYAVKLHNPSAFVEDLAKARKRFAREIEAMAALQHRSIVPVIEAGITLDGVPYVLMPLIQGASLGDACKGQDLDFVAGLFAEIADALSYAHANNVIHRDLKPSNVIVRESDNQPIILDFGCAYLLDEIDSQSLTTELVGTLAYIPSEVMVNPKRRSVLQDIYACGMMLYEVCASRRPDPNDYRPLAEISSVLAPVDEIVRGAICGERDRINSAAELSRQISLIGLGR